MTLWRTGRRVGRTIYLQLGPEPSDDDLLIGGMDTPVLATEAVDARNRGARDRRGRDVRNVGELKCGRAFRQEAHPPQRWKLQAQDDSPEVVEADCPGWKGGA